MMYMTIVVNLTDPETDIEDVRAVANRALNEEVLECLNNVFRYGLGETNNIDDDDLHTLLENGHENALVSDVDTVEGFQEELKVQREQTLTGVDREFNKVTSRLLDIVNYIFTGENQKAALDAQKRGISHDSDMEISIPIT